MCSGFRVEKATNGFVLNYEDPAIEAENRKNRKAAMPWKDPHRKLVFESDASLLAAIKKLMPLLKSDDEEYESAMSEVMSED